MKQELCYRNNPSSLFRRYQQLVTWFANTAEGHEMLSLPFNERVGLFLPNGYHKVLDEKYRVIEATFYSRSIYAPSLLLGLYKFDLMHSYLRDFSEAQKVFLWCLGLNRKEIAPGIVREILYSTATFYPDPNVETTSVDGRVRNTNAVWATCQSAATGDTADDSSVNAFSSSGIDGSSNYQINRGCALFDTSSLGEVEISAATQSFYVETTENSDNDGDDHYTIVNANPASNTALTTSDFGNLAGLIEYSSRQDGSGVATTAYWDFAFNATGLTSINKAGITKTAWREGHDLINSSYVGGSTTFNYIQFSCAETATTAQDPKLVITYTAAVNEGIFLRNPAPIQQLKFHNTRKVVRY